MALLRRIYNKGIETIHENLDETAFNFAMEKGKKMSLVEAVKYALGDDYLINISRYAQMQTDYTSYGRRRGRATKAQPELYRKTSTKSSNLHH